MGPGRSGALLAAALAFASGGARAGAPAEDLAWLLKSYPQALAGVRWTSLAPKLVAWVPPGGHRVAYLYTLDEACTEVELSRSRWAGNREEPAPILTGGMRRQVEPQEGGGFQRALDEVRLGHLLLEPCGGQTEGSTDGKRWRKTGHIWGCGDPPTLRGVLSSVTNEVARWGGEPQELAASCAGPWEDVACKNGGQRACDSCRTVDVSAHLRSSSSGGGVGHLSAIATIDGTKPVCTEPCPPVSHPDIKRVAKINAQTRPWRLNNAPANPPASLYLSRGRCLREHPSAAGDVAPDPAKGSTRWRLTEVIVSLPDARRRGPVGPRAPTPVTGLPHPFGPKAWARGTLFMWIGSRRPQAA